MLDFHFEEDVYQRNFLADISMVRYILIFSQMYLVACGISSNNSCSYLYHHSHKRYLSLYEPGDIILAGMFSVHLEEYKDEGHLQEDSCSGQFNRHSYQMVQAMIFAISQINQNKTILPGVKLGYDIKDTCGTVENTIRVALNYSFVWKHFRLTDQCGGDKNNSEINVTGNLFTFFQCQEERV